MTQSMAGPIPALSKDNNNSGCCFGHLAASPACCCCYCLVIFWSLLHISFAQLAERAGPPLGADAERLAAALGQIRRHNSGGWIQLPVHLQVKAWAVRCTTNNASWWLHASCLLQPHCQDIRPAGTLQFCCSGLHGAPPVPVSAACLRQPATRWPLFLAISTQAQPAVWQPRSGGMGGFSGVICTGCVAQPRRGTPSGGEG